ncbi:MAG: accessory gene regulator B family protein [Bacilli bacterium]|jgi:accessory gene regulator B|nr:accessory gene regulator B family protein [Bacilli bacterium]
MKNILINNGMDLIKKHYTNLNQAELEEIKYGLEGFYLTFSKILILFIVAYLINVHVNFILLIFFFNIIRFFAHGFHARNSIVCFIISFICFILLPYFIQSLTINLITKIILITISIISIFLYAPADTHKKPIIKIKKRQKLKIIALITCIVYSLIVLFSTNTIIINCILLALLLEIITILPITYKLFNLPYRNYQNYSSK